MDTVAGVVVPVFGTVALGWVLARTGLLSGATGAALVRFMYYLAIPAMLFSSLAAADLPDAPPWTYLAAFYLPSFFVFALAMRLARRLLGWARPEAGMAGMVSGYSNMVLLGLPLGLGAYGAAGAVPLFILLATQSSLIFPLTTLVLERGAGGGSGRLLRLLANPILWSLALGVAANLAGYRPPAPVGGMIAMLGNAGPACALVALGVSLAGYRLRGGYAEVAVLVALKNGLHPALVWLACLALGIDGVWLEVAVLLAVMPCGINAFIFASQYGVREATVSKCIVASTVVSSVTTTLLLGHFLT
ncbi:MAG: AEC family transporter [Gammaproteobacteria bacterium]